jgi:hypothetical protein
MSRFEFVPSNQALNGAAGFRDGARGTHTSRTMMLAELAAVLRADSADCERAIIEDNILGKLTMSGRVLSLQRLRELYGLDNTAAIYKVLRALWKKEPGSLPQLAILAALARDPLLRATAKPVLGLAAGSELMRDTVRHAVSSVVGARLNTATLDKVIRNAASSWSQSGHLEGRTFKRRRRISATPTAAAFAIWLAQKAGFTGVDLLSNCWISILDADGAALDALIERARASGLLDVRQLGSRREINAARLLPGGAD